MDTNKLLKTIYGNRYNFGEIARFAAMVAQTTKSEKKVLEAVEMEFGTPVIKMLDKARPYKSFLPETSDPETLASNSAALDQLKTALRLPVAMFGALMPDAHLGYSLPIGGVVALQGAISPAFVGYDIGCRMHLSILDGVTVKDVQENKAMWLDFILKSTSFGLGSNTSGNDHPVMHREEWKTIPYLKGLKELAQSQLGSSGAGNHFADIVSCQSTHMFYWSNSLPKSFVALMTHSGSRGVGNKAGHYYAELAEAETKARGYSVEKGYGFLLLDTDAGKEYWDVMNLLGDYAKANHEIIHEKFMKVAGAKSFHVFDNHHNFAWAEEGMIVHRKGATPAGIGQIGIIPGSSGTASYIVKGLGDEQSLNSASHGAGRPHSRSEAKRRFDEKKFKSHMKEKEILAYGVAQDETFMAYKDIETVMAAQKDLVVPIAKMYPEVVVMGGATKGDDGD